MIIHSYPTRQVVENLNFDKEQLRKFKNRFGCYNEVSHKYLYWLQTDLGEGRFVIPKYYGISNSSLYQVEEVIVHPPKIPAIRKHLNLKETVTFKSEQQRKAFLFLEQRIAKGSYALMLNLRTGLGKTFLAIKLLTTLKYKTIIIVDKLDLIKQWKKEILRFTNIEAKQIKIALGTPALFNLIDNPEEKVEILFTTYQSLAGAVEKDIDFFHELQKTWGLGLKIMDEVHKEIKALFTIDSLNYVPYNLYLTATPARSDPASDKLLKYILPFNNSYGLSLESNIYHKILLVDYKTFPTPAQKVEIEQDKYGFNVVKYSAYVADSGWKQFSELLTELLKQLYQKRLRKTFIIFKTLSLLDKTVELLNTLYPTIPIGRFTGSVKKSERTEQISNEIVVCTEKIFQTGIDVPDLEILINTFPMSSQVLTEQILGRLRQNTKGSLYVDITDISFSKTINQRRRRMEIFDKFAKEIFTMNFVKTVTKKKN
jgi:superfamily II DNA or RNA helicase